MKKQVLTLAKTGTFTVLLCLFTVILGIPTITIGSAFINFGTTLLIAFVIVIAISGYFTFHFDYFARLMSHL